MRSATADEDKLNPNCTPTTIQDEEKKDEMKDVKKDKRKTEKEQEGKFKPLGPLKMPSSSQSHTVS